MADGYGNKRIIVFDADTGAFRRMWGAFGNVPSDDTVGTPADSETGGRDPNRIPAKEIDPSDPGPPQFNTVHGVKVSNDGFVYAADRGNKRVQVFTLDGTFVKQAFVDRWCEEPQCGNGQTVASIAFSADPEQRLPVRCQQKSGSHLGVRPPDAGAPRLVRGGRAWRPENSTYSIT